MDLAEYIEKSLIAISKGVTEAMQKADVTIAAGFIEGKPIFEPQMVKFEIEVTASTEGGGGIKVLSIADMSAGLKSQHSHRITFEVPVHFNSHNSLKKR
jgi:hypothetical protein